MELLWRESPVMSRCQINGLSSIISDQHTLVADTGGDHLWDTVTNQALLCQSLGGVHLSHWSLSSWFLLLALTSKARRCRDSDPRALVSSRAAHLAGLLCHDFNVLSLMPMSQFLSFLGTPPDARCRHLTASHQSPWLSERVILHRLLICPSVRLPIQVSGHLILPVIW